MYSYKNISLGILDKENSNHLSILHNHDLNGNIISTNFGPITTQYEYDFGERIKMTGKYSRMMLRRKILNYRVGNQNCTLYRKGAVPVPHPV